MWLQHQCCNPSGRMANEAAAPVAAARQVGRWGGGRGAPLHHRRGRQRPHVEAGEPRPTWGRGGEPASALSMLNVNVEVWPVAKAPQDSHPSWRGPPPPQFGLVPGAGGLPLPRWCHCYFKACGPAQHIPSPVVSPMPQDTAHGLGF